MGLHSSFVFKLKVLTLLLLLLLFAVPPCDFQSFRFIGRQRKLHEQVISLEQLDEGESIHDFVPILAMANLC